MRGGVVVSPALAKGERKAQAAKIAQRASLLLNSDKNGF
jgi:hypothetical protein